MLSEWEGRMAEVERRKNSRMLKEKMREKINRRGRRDKGKRRRVVEENV